MLGSQANFIFFAEVDFRTDNFRIFLFVNSFLPVFMVNAAPMFHKPGVMCHASFVKLCFASLLVATKGCFGIGLSTFSPIRSVPTTFPFSLSKCAFPLEFKFIMSRRCVISMFLTWPFNQVNPALIRFLSRRLFWQISSAS